MDQYLLVAKAVKHNPVSNTQIQDADIEDEFHHPQFSVFRRHDGIIVTITTDDAWFTAAVTRDAVAARRTLANGKPHLFLFVPGRHMLIDKETRSFSATEEALQDIIAMAIVQRSKAQRIIANLYLSTEKPSKPTMLVDSMEEGITWLKNQIPS